MKELPSDSKKTIKSAFLTNFDATVKKYARGSLTFNSRKVKYKKLRSEIIKSNERITEAATKAADAEILLPSTAGFIELEDKSKKVYKLKQSDIVQNVDLNSAKNAFELQLCAFGPYSVEFCRNGRNLLIGGSKGHIASLDCQQLKLGNELQLQESVYDVKYLHNETMLAVAQKNFVYIYDNKGTELHCMRKHTRPYRLDFLPYHFLLTSIGHAGVVRWHDISTGTYVAEYSTGHGPCKVLRHNPNNAVVHCGHTNGIVTLWTPASSKALISLLCHRSPVNDVAIDREGRYMVSSGLDGLVKVWDLRKYQMLHSYHPSKPVVSLDISDKGLIAMGLGRRVEVLQHGFTQPSDSIYLQHEVRAPNAPLSSGAGSVASKRPLLSSVAVNKVRFRPYEDVLGIGHSHGISTIIIPGAGEPNYDSYENNPFMTLKQRREGEVQSLLNKLNFEMIGIDSNVIGSVEKDDKLLKEEHQELFYSANPSAKSDVKEMKDRKRGRNKIFSKIKRKEKNVIDIQVQKARDAKEAAEKEKRLLENVTIHNETNGKDEDALQRFYKKKYEKLK